MKYLRNGREVSRQEFLSGSECNLEELLRDRQTLCGQSSEGWPMVSDSMAVHPLQAKEAHEQARALGVPTEFNGRGQPVLTDPGHRLRLAKALGFSDLTEHNITRMERD